MRCVHIARATQCLSCTSVTPINSHSICNGLRKVKRNRHSALPYNPDMQSCLAIVSYVHCTNIKNAIFAHIRLGVINVIVPSLTNKSLSCREFGEFAQGKEIILSVRMQDCSVIVVECHVILSCRWCVSSTTDSFYGICPSGNISCNITTFIYYCLLDSCRAICNYL